MAATDAIEYEVREITPQDARSWLSKRRASGALNTAQIRTYADDMRAGRWVLNGDPIIISDTGTILSGVLRLEACVRAECSFPSLVIRNIHDDKFETIDSVRRRTLADIFTIRQEKNGRALAAALAVLWRYAKDDYIRPKQRPSAQTLLALLEHNPDIRASMRLANDASRYISLGVVTALHYLFARVDAEKADEFFQALVDEEVDSGPAYLLRRQLAGLKDDRGARVQGFVIALFIKAWEAYRAGVERAQLKFAMGVEAPPRISDLDPTSLLEGLATTPARRDVPTQRVLAGMPHEAGIKVEVTEITPSHAQALLDHNENNRGVAALVVDKYRRDMKAGRWALNGQTIKIGKSGRLLDGQHRLLACTKASVPFPAIIVSGLEESVFETFDLGARRSIGEILKDRGEINTSALGAALRQLWLIENEVFVSRGAAPTVAELLDTLERHPDIRHSVRYGRRVIDVTAPTLIIALQYLFSRVDQARSEEFVERLIDGAELPVGHPILMLRDQLMQAKSKKKIGLPDTERAAWIIKAWNAYLEDRPLKRIKWQQAGPRKEPFPEIEGLQTMQRRAA